MAAPAASFLGMAAAGLLCMAAAMLLSSSRVAVTSAVARLRRGRRTDRQRGNAGGEHKPGHNETPCRFGVPTKRSEAAFLRRKALHRRLFVF
jgi:hypothetical protein